ncbi:MAG: TonB-dependent receptor [Steroidobacteraceae bacterium]|nr:TonB-dependent receptor [Steroidobacteraceae bacterium]
MKKPYILIGLLVAPMAQVLAQQPASDDPKIDEVLVTGYRAAIENAVETKRAATDMVDVIKSDDIASFPDANLAEAVQRIPGVSIDRDSGEGRSITVRGLGGDFVRTMLNGVEAFSATTGSTLGTTIINRSRGFDYSTFASELFNSVTVRKSQSAELDEGSLGATVELQTARPFDFQGLHMGASAQAAYYDSGDEIHPRGAGLISNTWADDRFGALISFAYNTRKAIEDGYSDTSQSDYSDTLGGFCTPVPNTPTPFVNADSGTGLRPNGQCFSNIGSNAAAYNAINAPNIFLPRNPGLGRFVNDQEKLGITSALQWRPADSTIVTLDVIYSKFDQNRKDYALSNASLNRNVNGASIAFPNFAGRVNSQIQEVEIGDSGQVDFMRLDNVDIKHIQSINESTTETFLAGLTVAHAFTDDARVKFNVSKTGSDFDEPTNYLISFDRFDTDGYVWDARDSQKRPFVNYNYDVANPASIQFVTGGVTPDIRINTDTVKNTLENLAAAFEIDLSDEYTLKFGATHKEYEFESNHTQRVFSQNSTDLTRFNFANFAAAVPSLSAVSEVLTGWGDGLDLPPGSVTSWVVPDIDKFISTLDLDCNCVNQFGDWTMGGANVAGSRGFIREVQEKDRALFAQLDFAADVGADRKLRGNVGVRYVETFITSTGLLPTIANPTGSITVENEYTDFLPSLNLALDLTPELITRLAVAKVMSRPGLGNLTPGGTVNNAATPPNASIGNPYLDPYRATNYDLSLEWYPGKGSLLSGAIFYRDVKSYIQQTTSDEPYANTGLPVAYLAAGQTPDTLYRVTNSRNTPGGFIQGFEFNYQQSFTFLPGIWSHFGTLINYTYVESEIDYFLSTSLVNPMSVKSEFVGVSPNSINATVFYEDEKFSARVSAAYRDDYLQLVPIKNTLADVRGSAETLNVDASVSFTINEHVKLNFDALNLTNQATDNWSGETRRSQRVTSVTGRQFFFGAQYSY